jgi:hypothetical protein
MRAVVALALVVAICSAGCGNGLVDTPGAPPPPQQPSGAAIPLPPSAHKGKLTLAYWDRCIEVNTQFVADKGEVWFKEFRPSAVGGTCREAAKQLREIDNAGIDPEVIDHVNRVIRGFEQMGAIAETKGKESLWRDTAATVGFIIKVARGTHVGVVADGGSLAMGIGGSDQGSAASRDGQAQTAAVAGKLIDSEEQTIRHVRKTYGIELRPW